MEADLRTRLKNDAGVAAITTQVHWNERPQDTPYPAVIIEQVYGDRSQHMDGFNTFQATRTQFRCTATNRTSAIALREAVIAAIAPATTQGSTEFLRAQQISTIQRTESTGTGTLHHEIVDAQIWHN